MTARRALDRAAAALGAVSVVSALFVFLRGDFQFVRMRGWALVVALVLGLLAIVGAWLASRPLTVAAGSGFLIADVVLLALLSRGDGGFLDGNGSTFSLWLGLGVGLLALSITPPEVGSHTHRT